MKNKKRSTLAWYAAGLLCLTSAVACVDEQPSILLEGSLVMEGTLEGGDSENGVLPSLVCKTLSGNIQGSKTFFSRGHIDLAGLKRPLGQDSSYSDATSGVLGSWGQQNVFSYVAGFHNRLPNSNNVGAQSGSGSGGFQGMHLDSNVIQTSGAVVRFSSDSNTFQTASGEVSFPEFEEFRSFSAMISSENGWAGLPIPILDGAGEVALFENFLRNELGNPAGPVSFMAEIQVKGKTLAGTEVESNIIRYPIDICVDCGMGSTPTCVLSE